MTDLGADPGALTGVVLAAVCGAILLVTAVWIPLVGWAPRWALRWEARLIRCAKGASGRPGAKRFTYDEIAPGVLLGALPHGAEDVRSLQQLRGGEGVGDERDGVGAGGNNVRCFVTMNEAWEMPGGGRTTTVDELRSLGIQVLWLATPDYSAVSQADLRAGADFLQDCVAAGNTCYVHCNGGRGRSTSVVLAWLVLHQRMDALSALRLCESKRKIANFLCCCATRPQWRAIRRFEKSVHKMKNNNNGGAKVAPEGGEGTTVATGNMDAGMAKPAATARVAPEQGGDEGGSGMPKMVK